jgi:hypothetical protein
MREYGLYESASVKIQTLKTAIEVRRCLPCPFPFCALRIPIVIR